MMNLFDTNILVYRYDGRDPVKQAQARELIRMHVEAKSAFLAHQNIVEFISATTKPLRDANGQSILEPQEALWEANELMSQLTILFPSVETTRLAMHGWQSYGLNWFDALIWSYAEYYDIDTIYSEDFQHDRTYGTVHVVNPFVSD